MPHAYNREMKICEIYHVPAGRSFAWKWRHASNGRVIESKEKYELYYECVSAALLRGYQPDIKCLAPAVRPRLAAHSRTPPAH